MKALKKVMVVMVAVALILPVVAVNEAHAALLFYTCTVDFAGVNGAGIPIIKLTDVNNAFSGKMFQLNTYNSFAMSASLSTALTAMASGMQVYAGVNSLANDPVPICKYIVLLSQ
jgi:hypothetical protein